MRFYFKVITTPCADTSGTAILLHFDNRRYIFGQISEGTQRACLERGLNLLNVRHMFLTGQIGWPTVGGLLGFILTLADSHAARLLSNPELSKPTLNITGGTNLQHFLATARHFIFRKSLPLSITELGPDEGEFSEQPTWSDDNIQVWAMNLKQNEDAELGFDDLSGTKPKAEPGLEDNIRQQQMRQDVVDQMFNSDWGLDKLDEVPLNEVNMPATLFVRNPETKGLELYTGPLPGTQEVPNINVFVRRPWPGSTTKNLPRAKESKRALAYIVKSQPTRGKFLPAKAKLHDVPAGPLFSKLSNGISVQSRNGSWVHPDMVMEKATPGTGLAIVDLTSGDFERDLCDRPEWKSPKIMQGVEAIIWLLKAFPSHVDYINNFAKLFPHIRHYYSSPSACPNSINFQSSASSSVRLASLAPEHFAIPLHQNHSVHDLHRQNPDWSLSQNLTPVQQTPLERGLMIQMRPKFAVQRQEVPQAFDADVLSKSISEELQETIAGTRARCNDEDSDESELPGKDVEIITLGTGSALPSKYRNVSATLMRVPGHGSYLFDCGEGTLGQLKRMFPPDELRSILLDLKMIWISHLHADHHLGLINILKSYNLMREEDEAFPTNKQSSMPADRRLIIASDGDLFTMLDEYSSTGDLSLDKCLLLSCRPRRVDENLPYMTFNEYLPGGALRDFDLQAHAKDSGGLTKMLFCPVSHCRNALAVSLRFPDGFKVSYSGDCRPSEKFIFIGLKSTVLIHEATFDDEKAGDAIAKKHCTIQEALGVGVAMQAKRILLTHFSQRYQKLPTISDIKPAAIAFEDVSGSQETSSSPLNDGVNHSTDSNTQNLGKISGGAENDGSPKSRHASIGLSQPQAASENPPPQPSGDAAMPDTLVPGHNLYGTFQSPFFPENPVPTSTQPAVGGEGVSERKESDREPNPSLDGDIALPTPSSKQDIKVAFAFDLMRLKVRDFPKMEKLSGSFQDLFKTTEQTVDDTDQPKTEGEQSIGAPNSLKRNDRGVSFKGKTMNEQQQIESDRKRRKVSVAEESSTSVRCLEQVEGGKFAPNRTDDARSDPGASEPATMAEEVKSDTDKMQTGSKSSISLARMTPPEDETFQNDTSHTSRSSPQITPLTDSNSDNSILMKMKERLERRLDTVGRAKGTLAEKTRINIHHKLQRVQKALAEGVPIQEVPKTEMAYPDWRRERFSESDSTKTKHYEPEEHELEEPRPEEHEAGGLQPEDNESEKHKLGGYFDGLKNFKDKLKVPGEIVQQRPEEEQQNSSTRL